MWRDDFNKEDALWTRKAPIREVSPYSTIRALLLCETTPSHRRPSCFHFPLKILFTRQYLKILMTSWDFLTFSTIQPIGNITHILKTSTTMNAWFAEHYWSYTWYYCLKRNQTKSKIFQTNIKLYNVLKKYCYFKNFELKMIFI